MHSRGASNRCLLPSQKHQVGKYVAKKECKQKVTTSFGRRTDFQSGFLYYSQSRFFQIALLISNSFGLVILLTTIKSCDCFDKMIFFVKISKLDEFSHNYYISCFCLILPFRWFQVVLAVNSRKCQPQDFYCKLISLKAFCHLLCEIKSSLNELEVLLVFIASITTINIPKRSCTV